jgi:hypothetical protein
MVLLHTDRSPSGQYAPTLGYAASNRPRRRPLDRPSTFTRSPRRSRRRPSRRRPRHMRRSRLGLRIRLARSHRSGRAPDKTPRRMHRHRPRNMRAGTGRPTRCRYPEANTCRRSGGRPRPRRIATRGRYHTPVVRRSRHSWSHTGARALGKLPARTDPHPRARRIGPCCSSRKTDMVHNRFGCRTRRRRARSRSRAPRRSWARTDSLGMTWQSAHCRRTC